MNPIHISTGIALIDMHAEPKSDMFSVSNENTDKKTAYHHMTELSVLTTQDL